MHEVGKEIRTQIFSHSPNFDYLPESDRYITRKEASRHRFALIGAGMMGQEHLRVTHLEGRATIAGIYDPNPSSLRRTIELAARTTGGAEPKLYSSVREACWDPEVDGIIVCTPNHTHISVAREAAKSRKNVLMEKPMATTIKDAYEIYELASAHPAVFQIGLQYRFKAIYAEAIREALRGRAIGTIKTVNILEHRIPFLDKVGQWNKFSRFSGGTLVEKCCHYFDLCNLFAGSRPKRVYASGSAAVNFRAFEYRGQKSDILDNATVVVEYGNGARATFSLCMFAPMFCEELILCGDEGRLAASEREDFLAGPRLRTSLEISCGANRPSRTGSPSYPSFIEDSGHNGATYFEHVKFVDDIERGRSDAATALEGFWSIAVAIAAETSVKTGEPVDIESLLAENGVALPDARA